MIALALNGQHLLPLLVILVVVIVGGYLHTFTGGDDT